jgi:uncharacterized RDD family membrane protein YckC
MTNPYAPPHAVVADIIDPAAGILLADRGTRLGASILDGMIFMLMVYAPLIVGALLSAGTQTASSETDSEAALGIGMVLALIGFLVWLGINITFMKNNGQSIGKKACAIKVVRRDGSPASLSRLIWLRNVVNIFLGVIPLYGVIDALFIFGNARRCVHDHLADTIVVKA